MEENKKYYAFISYKREDEKWAKWLQQKLENYKLPAVIRKDNTNIPKYIRPVFRDKTDLVGSVLSEQLRTELRCSKFLIVICSPNTTQSEWVNKEVQTFIDEGRIEQIIPFIVNGIPHASNPNKECFPKALLDLPSEKELLGINVQEVGKDVALVRLVATLLGLRFDTLWQRHRRRILRHRITAAIATLLLLFTGIFIWDYNRPTYACFADYVDCYGVPKGVIPLNDEQVKKRNCCFLFEYRRIPFGEPNAYGWRVSKVSYVNSALRPQEISYIEWIDRYPVLQIEYNEETGMAARINFCDVNGKVLLRHVLSERNGVPATVADFIASREHQGTEYVGASLSSLSMGEMGPGQNKANIVRYVYERNADGYIIRQTYHSNNDYQLSRSAVSDADGIYGKQYTLDSLGRRIRIDYLDIEGEKTCTQKGIAGCSYEYEPNGNIQKYKYFNLNDCLVLNEFKWAMVICNINSDGNVAEECKFDTEGNPCVNNYGVAKVTRKHDERGNVTEVCYFDTEGNPCVSNQGIAKLTHIYDERGNITETCCFDTEGNPCVSIDGFTKFKKKYDERGNTTEICYFDTKGSLCVSNKGFAKVTHIYDERNNIIEACYFDTKGNPCVSNQDFAKLTRKYDERDNIEEEHYFDTKGNPCISNQGFAKVTQKHDERGNIEEACWFDTEGNSCVNNYGFAKVTIKYDERGNTTEECYFDTEGDSCVNNYGVAKVTIKYDERGNTTEECYFDTKGSLCVSNKGFAKVTHIYDERNNIIEACYFDTEGNPCISIEGIAKITKKYDERGNVTEECCFDTEGNPCVSNYGFAKVTSKYNERDNMTEVCYFNTKGDPCVNSKGIAKLTRKYDKRGNVTEECYFDTEGNSCVNNYDFAKVTSKYNERNNMTEVCYFNTKGDPCVNSEGIAKITKKYDERGNVTEECCFDTKGNPCVNSEGIAKITRKYNERGDVTEICHYDTLDIPINIKGYFKKTIIYDNHNNIIEYIYTDDDGYLLSKQVFSLKVDFTQGENQTKRIPEGSIVLQWNDWKIGGSQAEFMRVAEKSRYYKKDIYYLTPSGDIVHFYVDRGMMNVNYLTLMVEKSYAQEWLKRLEKWKAENKI